MKASSLLLAGSLLANVVLLAGFVAGVSDEAGRPSATPAPKMPVPTPTETAATVAGMWTELHADDLREQAAKLRADGFPPRMIRAIIGAQVSASFAARRKALEAAQGEQPFWRQSSMDPATQAALRALSKEQEQAIKDVLGPDNENGQIASLRRQLPNFSEASLEQIAALRERYGEERAAIYASARGGTVLPEERAKADALDKAMHGEIAAILSPQELEEYDLRMSNTANQLRYRLAAFDPTEQEFRALYQLQSAFDNQYGMYSSGTSDAERRARSDAQKALNDQFKAALGPARYEQYERAIDYNYRQTTQLMARLNLPPETANSLYAIQKEFEQRRSELYRSTAGARPSMAQTTSQATALQQEALARVTPLLGDPKYVDAYKQHGGSWLANLVPRPPPPQPPTAKKS